MRSAEAAARGTMTNMMVAISTGQQDLHDVGEEGGEVADGHAVVGDLDAAEPHDGDGREVEDRGERRDHQREQPVDPERRVGEVALAASKRCSS